MTNIKQNTQPRNAGIPTRIVVKNVFLIIHYNVSI